MRYRLFAALLATVPIWSSASAEQLTLSVDEAAQVFDTGTGVAAISVRLDEESAEAFALFSRKHVGQAIDLVIDRRVVSTPVIQEPILGRMLQIGNFRSVQDANEIVVRLRSGKAELSVSSKD